STNECTHIIPSGAATEKDEKNKSPSYPKHVDSAFASFFLVFLESSQDGLSHLTLRLSRAWKPERSVGCKASAAGGCSAPPWPGEYKDQAAPSPGFYKRSSLIRITAGRKPLAL